MAKRDNRQQLVGVRGAIVYRAPKRSRKNLVKHYGPQIEAFNATRKPDPKAMVKS